MANYTDAVMLLRERRQLIVAKLGKIDMAIKAMGGIRVGGATTRRKPKISAAGIARIRAAQKARWAKIKAAQK